MDPMECAYDIEILPNEVLVVIFSFLGLIDRLRIACVSRRWYNVMQDARVWNTIDLRQINFCNEALRTHIPKIIQCLRTHLRESTRVVTLRYCSDTPGIYDLIQEICPKLREISYDIPATINHNHRRKHLFLYESMTKVSVKADPYPTFHRGFSTDSAVYFSLHQSSTKPVSNVPSDTNCSLKVIDLCGVLLNVDSIRNINISHTLKHLHLRWPFFESESDLECFLKYVARTYKVLESLMISWPMLVVDKYFTSALDEFIDSLTTNKLKKLVLRGIKGSVRYASMEKLTYEQQHLEVLQFDECRFVDDLSIQCIANNMTKLKDLSVSAVEEAHVTDSGLMALKSHTSLQRLDISGQNLISDTAIVETVSTLPCIKELTLHRSSRSNKTIRAFIRSRRDLTVGFR